MELHQITDYIGQYAVLLDLLRLVDLALKYAPAHFLPDTGCGFPARNDCQHRYQNGEPTCSSLGDWAPSNMGGMNMHVNCSNLLSGTRQGGVASVYKILPTALIFTFSPRSAHRKSSHPSPRHVLSHPTISRWPCYCPLRYWRSWRRHWPHRLGENSLQSDLLVCLSQCRATTAARMYPGRLDGEPRHSA